MIKPINYSENHLLHSIPILEHNLSVFRFKDNRFFLKNKLQEKRGYSKQLEAT
jgi:hypothetical protein